MLLTQHLFKTIQNSVFYVSKSNKNSHITFSFEKTSIFGKIFKNLNYYEQECFS